MSHQRRIRTLIPLAAALLAALTLMGAAIPGRTSAAVVQATAVVAPDAPPPPLITYQGRLVVPATGEPVPDGTYYARFDLWASEIGGSSLWGEDVRIEPRNGLFSVTLGTVNPIDPALFDGYDRWLSVSIQPDGPLTPRIRIAHAPYAIYANRSGSAVVADLAANAERLGGQPPGAYAAASHTHDAANITSGTLAVARYSAIADLTDEGYLGNASGDLAVNNGTVQTNLNADLLDGNHSSAFAAASHTHTGASIVDGSLGTVDLADGSVTSAKIADGGVALADLAASSVDSSKIVDLSVATGDLANSSVTAAKISSSGASTNHVLQYTGSAVAWGYAPGSEIRYTVLNVDCASVASFTTTYVKVADIGSVSKLDASSRLEITFNGRIYAGSVTSSGAVFELRVDNAATTNGRARANLKAAEVGGAGVPVSMMGIFTGLGAGTHTVSIWVAASYGSGTNAYVDPGCWSSDHVVVREIK